MKMRIDFIKAPYRQELDIEDKWEFLEAVPFSEPVSSGGHSYSNRGEYGVALIFVERESKSA